MLVVERRRAQEVNSGRPAGARVSPTSRIISRCSEAVIPLLWAACLVWLVPLRTAFEFNSCEGYELMKGLLFSLGYRQAPELWNDQPPLHTLLLEVLFRLWGPSAYAARLLQVVFSSLLLWCLFRLVHMQVGWFGAAAAVVLLVVCPVFIPLSVGVILELPAMAVGMASVLAWQYYSRSRTIRWAVLSGALMGWALQIKLTAGLWVVPLVVDWAAGYWSKHRGDPSGTATGAGGGADPNPVEPGKGAGWCEASGSAALRAHCCAGLGWLVACGLAFGMVATLCTERFDVFVQSHFSAGTLAAGSAAAFTPRSLLEWPELVVASGAGLALLGSGAGRRLALSAVALCAVLLLVHLAHRPFWPYYMLHFAIALAWLGGLGLGECVRGLRGSGSNHSLVNWLAIGARCLALSVTASLLMLHGPHRVIAVLQQVRSARAIASNPAVTFMRQYRDRTHWVFTDRVIYAFHISAPVPPELAVVPGKRVWSGQITSVDILSALARYRPEQIALFGPLGGEPELLLEPQLLAFIQSNYFRLPDAPTPGLYLLRSAWGQP
jgi:hypothetical protein